MKRILVNHQVCSGCRACEVACVVHNERKFGRSAARIRVSKNESIGLDFPHVCRQCGKAPCVAACPVGALEKEPSTGAIRVISETCIGCAACVDACPFGAAYLHPQTGLAMICDLCAGDPSCVKRCATGAIRYVDIRETGHGRRGGLAHSAWKRARKAGDDE